MKQNMYLMGIDIGSYESKGVIIDNGGNLIASASIGHDMENPKPNYFEHDAIGVWWHDFCHLSHTLLSSGGLDSRQIGAVGVSTLGTDCLPVDQDFNPLRKAILYGIDARSQEEIRYLTEYYGEEQVRNLFGRPICSGDVCTKILWIKNHEPEIYNKTSYFLTGSSFLVAKLTGNAVIDRFLGIASLRPLYREDGTIREEMCGPFCRPDQLPVGKTATDMAGRVTPQAALETGLAAGTPVTVGTGDSAAEAVSTGVLSAGDLMLQFGSSVFLYCCTDHLIHDDRVRGNTFVIPGAFSIAAGTNNCGTVTRWYRDRLYLEALAAQEAGKINAYEAMMKEAAGISPGSEGLITLPYFSGERTPINDPSAKGVVFGLGLAHTKAHLYRSALEGVAYSVWQHIDILEENSVNLRRIMAVGGGTRNPLWMQIVADATGKTINTAKITVGASYGDALMAGILAGVFGSFADLAAVIKPDRVYVPNMEHHEIYRRNRHIFDLLYLSTKDLMHML